MSSHQRAVRIPFPPSFGDDFVPGEESTSGQVLHPMTGDRGHQPKPDDLGLREDERTIEGGRRRGFLGLVHA